MTLTCVFGLQAKTMGFSSRLSSKSAFVSASVRLLLSGCEAADPLLRWLAAKFGPPLTPLHLFKVASKSALKFDKAASAAALTSGDFLLDSLDNDVRSASRSWDMVRDRMVLLEGDDASQAVLLYAL